MLRFIRQKIVNQLWLSLCLVLGISLLVSIFCCHPLFTEGSLSRLLNQMFMQHMETENVYPTVIGLNGKNYEGDFQSAQDVLDVIRQQNEVWESDLAGISVINRQTRIRIDFEMAKRKYSDKEASFNICFMPEILEHSQILKGKDFNSEMMDNSCYPCMVSEKVMDEQNLSFGETIEFRDLKNDKKEHATLVITGVYSEKDAKDLFWYMTPNEALSDVYVSEVVFDTLLNEYHPKRIFFKHATLLDYHAINCDNIQHMSACLERYTKENESFYHSFDEFIDEYVRQKHMVTVMLWVMELPIIGMIFAFIYMLSNQIIESERAEIATMKSRGISRFQVIIIYAVRLSLLAVISTACGIPLGYGFCKVAASTTDFLTFAARDTSTYHMIPEAFYYGFAASLIGIGFILIPVIKHSRISIVEYTSDYERKPVFFERYFIDFGLLALSLYLLYSSGKSIDVLRTNALNDNRLDPVVFLNVSLFITAAGMVAFRLMHYVIMLVYSIRKKRWKSVTYVAFLQITRTFRKQTFISIFMILTVAMGLFNANAARTINRNNEDRIQYTMGADVRFTEKWETHQYSAGVYRYIEPDYSKFQKLIDEGLCEDVTKVMHYKSTNAEIKGQYLNHCQVFGIDTKQFGMTAELKEELNTEKHWFLSLNALAAKPNGVIISSNLAEAYSLREGDRIIIHPLAQGGIMDESKKLSVNVVDIVDAWPGFEQYYEEKGTSTERYLMVVNQTVMLQNFDMRPYEIWARLADGVTAEEVRQFLCDNELELTSFDSAEARINLMKDSPKIQITNGMFTLSFMIAMGLCAVGFLIYWITSIGKRELLFGVYRAMGMSVRNLNRMLVYEHIFSTLLSVLSGGAVGMLTTVLFIKIFSVVHLPEKSVLDVYIYYEPSDVIKLFFVIAVVIIVCLLLLRRLIKQLNITQALKMGED